MAGKKSSAKSVAKNSGQPDFGTSGPKDLSGERTVTGPGAAVPSSGTPDFEDGKMGGNKTVKCGGEADCSQAYKTIKTAHTEDSEF